MMAYKENSFNLNANWPTQYDNGSTEIQYLMYARCDGVDLRNTQYAASRRNGIKEQNKDVSRRHVQIYILSWRHLGTLSLE